MIPPLVAAAIGASGRGWTLSAGLGGLIFVGDPGPPHDSLVGIRFNTDGTVEAGVAIDSASMVWSSWGIWAPASVANTTDFSVRYTNRVGAEDFTFKAAAEDSFATINTTRTWIWQENSSGVLTFDCDFEVRYEPGGRPDASAAYTFRINNELGL